MSAGGLSKARLGRMHDVTSGHVERGEVPELVTLVGRRGEAHGYGTSWSSDPQEEMVAILMTQRAGFRQTSGVYLDFWTSVYQAIDD